MEEIPWVIDEHTKVKHELLRKYIATWMAILFNQQERMGIPPQLLYFDGFSGPGIYYAEPTKTSTCLGSPLIVGEIANKFLDEKGKREFSIICIDKEQKCVDILNEGLRAVDKHDQKWMSECGEFDSSINQLLDDLKKHGDALRPAFFLIDPFGYSGFHMNTLKRILENERSELFINFMIYDIIRFIGEENFQQRMKQLFGCNDYNDVSGMRSSEEKQQFLVNLYCKQLHEYAGAKYVMPFRINTPGKGTRPRYYLIHASNHIKALKAMKDNMAKVSDAPYRFEAIGITSQRGFFEDPNKESLREMIKDYCKEIYPESIDYSRLEGWAYSNTNGVARTIKEALLELEQGKIVEIRRKEKQRNTTVTEGAMIKYKENR
jgi:three-Cys-motif partner protein